MEIKTQSHKPDPNKSGYCVVDKVFTNQEVLDQIEALLESIEHPSEGSALSHAEYVFYEKYNELYQLEKPFPLPTSDVSVALEDCSSGFQIRLLVKDNSQAYPIYHSFCTIKFYASDTAWLYIICDALRVAFREGRFC